MPDLSMKISRDLGDCKNRRRELEQMLREMENNCIELEAKLQAAQERERKVLFLCDLGSAEEFDDAMARLEVIKGLLQRHEEGQQDSGVSENE